MVEMGYDLAKIKQAVDEICIELVPWDGTVNWLSLRCVDVEYCVNLRGEETYRAYVEEASPNESKLQKVIRDKLAERDYVRIEVITSW